MRRKGNTRMIKEIKTEGENRTFRVPSKSAPKVKRTVRMLKTTIGSFVFKCDCPGYAYRQYKEPLFECSHIRQVTELLEKTRQDKINQL